VADKVPLGLPSALVTPSILCWPGLCVLVADKVKTTTTICGLTPSLAGDACMEIRPLRYVASLPRWRVMTVWKYDHYDMWPHSLVGGWCLYGNTTTTICGLTPSLAGDACMEIRPLRYVVSLPRWRVMPVWKYDHYDMWSHSLVGGWWLYGNTTTTICGLTSSLAILETTTDNGTEMCPTVRKGKRSSIEE
jgi:hypothetical protein